jgi:hypothetical protein
MAARPLTAGETDLARRVFGTAIDYDKVRVHDTTFLPGLPPDTAMAPNGQLYMARLYKPDYAQGNLRDQHLFIHEMTHVWQYQNKILHPIAAAADLSLRHKFNYGAAYAYCLEDGKDLLDYNMEQQACIVADHFHALCMGDAEKCAALSEPLSRFLENPCYARRSRFFGSPRKPGG